jgi:hypothetical protein
VIAPFQNIPLDVLQLYVSGFTRRHPFPVQDKIGRGGPRREMEPAIRNDVVGVSVKIFLDRRYASHEKRFIKTRQDGRWVKTLRRLLWASRNMAGRI